METIRSLKSPEYIWEIFESRLSNGNSNRIKLEMQDESTQMGFMKRNVETSLIFYQIAASEKQNAINFSNGLLEETDPYDSLMYKFASNIVISAIFLSKKYLEMNDYDTSLEYADMAQKFIHKMGLSVTESNSYKIDITAIKKDLKLKIIKRTS